MAKGPRHCFESHRSWPYIPGLIPLIRKGWFEIRQASHQTYMDEFVASVRINMRLDVSLYISDKSFAEFYGSSRSVMNRIRMGQHGQLERASKLTLQDETIPLPTYMSKGLVHCTGKTMYTGEGPPFELYPLGPADSRVLRWWEKQELYSRLSKPEKLKVDGERFRDGRLPLPYAAFPASYFEKCPALVEYRRQRQLGIECPKCPPQHKSWARMRYDWPRFKKTDRYDPKFY